MSTLLKMMLSPYMAPEDGGDASGGGGGGAPDRGDNIDPPKDTSAEDKVAADAQAEEDLKALDKGDDGEDEDDAGKARDDKGRFAKKDKDDDGRIPKSRFDDAVNKERAAREAAERRAEELAAKLKQEEKSVDVQKLEDSVEALEKQHAKLLLDGESEKAAEVMKQIRHTERQIARMESADATANATAQAVEQVRMDAAIAQLEAATPQFNPDSAEFDEDLVNLVLAEQARLMREDRLSPSKALLAAGNKIINKFIARSDTKQEDKRGLGAAKGEDRKKQQVDKNLDTAKRQPESMRQTGSNSDAAGLDKIDVSTLSAEEFSALPEATKRRLRGDAL